METGLQFKQNRLVNSVVKRSWLRGKEDILSNFDAVKGQNCTGSALKKEPVLKSTNQVDDIHLSTFSLVETLEYNFLRREPSYYKTFENNATLMGSSVSLTKSSVPGYDETEETDRPSSVEICVDPGLEEAEGIAHAQLVPKINATLEGVSLDNSDFSDEPQGFANILDEFKFSVGGSKSQRGKTQQKPRTGQMSKSESNLQSSKLNLTLMGLKAKQVDRVPTLTTTPRSLTTRDRSQRNRNPNVMKSMEDRLSAKPNTNKKPNWNQNFMNKDKLPPIKNGRFRKPIRKLNLLSAIKPCNLETEKEKFFASNFTINPQFEYRYLPSESILARHSHASSFYLDESIAILCRVLERYGNYEKFEAATGGRLLTKTEIWNTVKRYLEKEGFYGDVVVDISNDLLSRAAMTINSGRPTLSIRESSAREYWVEGLLRHEVGTHHLRFHNNRQQVWHPCSVRRQMELQPANPTEEGLASLHSVLLRKDPSLWRAAMLYYAVHKASRSSFVELFADLGKFLDSPEVRWDYCLRTKRGQTDTSRPGCFCKDQVYLNGILALLQRRKTLDFHALCTMGKVSYEDIEKLREKHVKDGTKIPTFMKDIDEYRRRLDYIVHMNGLEQFLEMQNKEDID